MNQKEKNIIEQKWPEQYSGHNSEQSRDSSVDIKTEETEDILSRAKHSEMLTIFNNDYKPLVKKQEEQADERKIKKIQRQNN